VSLTSTPHQSPQLLHFCWPSTPCAYWPTRTTVPCKNQGKKRKIEVSYPRQTSHGFRLVPLISGPQLGCAPLALSSVLGALMHSSRSRLSPMADQEIHCSKRGKTLTASPLQLCPTKNVKPKLLGPTLPPTLFPGSTNDRHLPECLSI
jgi:hypothetical protein